MILPALPDSKLGSHYLNVGTHYCQKKGKHSYTQVTQTTTAKGTVAKTWYQCQYCGFIPKSR